MNSQKYNSVDYELFEKIADALAEGKIRRAGNCMPIFNRMSMRFPALGSKVDWGNIRNSVQEYEPNCDIEDALDFSERMQDAYQLSGKVIYVADGVTECALEGDIEDMLDILPTLLRIRQHHYILEPKMAWCLSITMAFEFNFGFAKNVTRT